MATSLLCVLAKSVMHAGAKAVGGAVSPLPAEFNGLVLPRSQIMTV